MIFVAFQAGIVHPSHLRMLLKPLGHFQGVLAMARHTEMERFESEIEQETVVGGGD